ncbi:unnamed protein product, partial [Staurois parvus]
QTVGDFCTLCASACADPALSLYVAYHFVAELLNVHICFHYVIPLTVDCGIFNSKEMSWMDLLHR